MYISRQKLSYIFDLCITFQIPLINSNASHNLPDNSLVRFRGMVQDMHNPEFYFEQFEIFNTATNEVKNKSGKYRDTANILVIFSLLKMLVRNSDRTYDNIVVTKNTLITHTYLNKVV